MIDKLARASEKYDYRIYCSIICLATQVDRGDYILVYTTKTTCICHLIKGL